jgi:hypothetical protein
MTYVKTLLVGLIGALVATVLWIVVPIFVSVVWSTRSSSFVTNGSGGIGAVSSGILVPTGFSILLAALVGFTIAAMWYLRRSRRVSVDS